MTGKKTTKKKITKKSSGNPKGFTCKKCGNHQFWVKAIGDKKQCYKCGGVIFWTATYLNGDVFVQCAGCKSIYLWKVNSHNWVLQKGDDE